MPSTCAECDGPLPEAHGEIRVPLGEGRHARIGTCGPCWVRVRRRAGGQVQADDYAVILRGDWKGFVRGG